MKEPETNPATARPTIKTLSKLTGFSIATISKALHDSPVVTEETKLAIRKAAGGVPVLLTRRNVTEGGQPLPIRPRAMAPPCQLPARTAAPPERGKTQPYFCRIPLPAAFAAAGCRSAAGFRGNPAKHCA